MTAHIPCEPPPVDGEYRIAWFENEPGMWDGYDVVVWSEAEQNWRLASNIPENSEEGMKP